MTHLLEGDYWCILYYRTCLPKAEAVQQSEALFGTHLEVKTPAKDGRKKHLCSPKGGLHRFLWHQEFPPRCPESTSHYLCSDQDEQQE